MDAQRECAHVGAELLCVSGQLVPAVDPVLRASDSGAAYGEGVFETIRVASGVPVALPLHLARMRRSLQHLGLEAHRPADRDWREAIDRLLVANGLGRGEAVVRLRVSPGRWLVTAEPMPASVLRRREGVELVAVSHRPQALAAHKTFCYLPYLLASRRARAHATPELAEALLIDPTSGEVLEGSTTALCVVEAGGTLRLPPRDDRRLPSVSVERLIVAAEALGVPIRRAPTRRDELRGAAGLWACNALLGAAPATALDGAPLEDRSATLRGQLSSWLAS